MTFGYRGYGARVLDLPTATQMLDTYASFGHNQLDTSISYGDGSCEEMLGDLQAPQRFSIATRFDPFRRPQGHTPEVLKSAVLSSLERLKAKDSAILYINARDTQIPIEETMSGVQGLFEAGLFSEFGLSNVSVAEVEEYAEVAARKGWVRPVVYQGIYNAVSRSVEAELLPSLRRLNMRFHAYNPLAGGAFAPTFGEAASVEAGSRFDESHQQGRTYRQRYWNDIYLPAMLELRTKCQAAGVSPIAAALRWLVHHSQLDGSAGDGIILGASSERHLRENLQAVQDGPLPEEVLSAMEEAGEATRDGWPSFAISR